MDGDDVITAGICCWFGFRLAFHCTFDDLLEVLEKDDILFVPICRLILVILRVDFAKLLLEVVAGYS